MDSEVDITFSNVPRLSLLVRHIDHGHKNALYRVGQKSVTPFRFNIVIQYDKKGKPTQAIGTSIGLLWKTNGCT